MNVECRPGLAGVRSRNEVSRLRQYLPRLRAPYLRSQVKPALPDRHAGQTALRIFAKTAYLGTDVPTEGEKVIRGMALRVLRQSPPECGGYLMVALLGRTDSFRSKYETLFAIFHSSPTFSSKK